MRGQEESDWRHKDGAGVLGGDMAVTTAVVMVMVMVKQEAAAVGGEEEEPKPWNLVAAG